MSIVACHEEFRQRIFLAQSLQRFFAANIRECENPTAPFWYKNIRWPRGNQLISTCKCIEISIEIYMMTQVARTPKRR
jgi:hypothetical protein